MKLKTKPRKQKLVDKWKKECEDRNNARNRDAFAVTKANRFLKDEISANLAIEVNRSTNHNDVEDALIELLDLQAAANEKAKS